MMINSKINKKEEIKNRIDLINKGEVPEGYKREFSYVIPNDWNIVPIKKILSQVKRPVDKPNEPYYRLSVKSHAKGTFHSFVEDPETVAMEELFKVKENDLIVNITFAWEHAIAIVKKEDEGLLVSHRFPTYEFRDNASVKFYENIIKFPKIKKMLGDMSPGGAGRNRVLNQKDFYNKLYVPYTINKEQEKIAEILNCCDKVIELKQKLLEEKRKEKKSILNKIFCNNFTDYRFEKIKDIAKFICDGDWIESKDQTNNGIRLIQTGNIGIGKFVDKRKSAKYISEDTFKSLNCTEVKHGDILVSRLPDPIGRACIVPKIENKAITAVDCMIVKLKKEYLPEYIIQYMNTSEYFKNIAKYTNSSTRDRIPRKELENIKIPIINIEKQKLISNYLSNIDLSLLLLEQELEQYKQLKKSLSQLLLTGIVRTV